MTEGNSKPGVPVSSKQERTERPTTLVQMARTAEIGWEDIGIMKSFIKHMNMTWTPLGSALLCGAHTGPGEHTIYRSRKAGVQPGLHHFTAAGEPG